MALVLHLWYPMMIRACAILTMLYVVYATGFVAAATIEITYSKSAAVSELFENPFYLQNPDLVRIFQSQWDPHVDFTAKPNYVNLVKSIRPGDKVVVGDRSFDIKNYIGGDSASRIFEIADGRVLRLSALGEFSTMRYYLEMYPIFKSSGVEIVKVYPNESNWYAIVTDKINNIVVLGEFLKQLKEKMENKIPYSDADMLKLRKLEPFEFSISQYSRMDDVHLGQIGFDGLSESWILFDWCRGAEEFKNISDKSPIYEDYIEYYYPNVVPQEIHLRIKAAIKRKRELIRSSACYKSLT